jgi:hypothetical protein
MVRLYQPGGGISRVGAAGSSFAAATAVAKRIRGLLEVTRTADKDVLPLPTASLTTSRMKIHSLFILYVGIFFSLSCSA